MLSEHPYIGVSARIVEQYARSDGKFYPAAVQHVLATTDPRIPGLGAWQAVEMANESSITIDLSSYAFAGEPAPAADDTLTDAELADLISAISEAEAEGYPDDDQLSDAELERLMLQAEADESGQHDAFSEFDAAFTARQQADQAREDARAAAILEDTLHPARRDEDGMARIMARAQDGLYDGQLADFTAEAAGVEILLANGGHGPCGPVDDFGRCSARYHDLECGHSQATDWLAQEGGPPRSTYVASFANFATGLAIDLAPRQVWDDPDEPEQTPIYMPQRTVELAASLADEWGLHGDAWATPSATDLLRAPGAPVTMQDALLADMGYEMPAVERPSYPGVSDIRARMGL